MEGTSGAADCVPFREGTREAALSGGGLAKAGLSPGGYVKALIEGLHRRRHLHVCVEACSRHEVSEPIGLGNPFHHERSWWKAQALDYIPASPLTRDISAG
jgi:hypothetical protein